MVAPWAMPVPEMYQPLQLAGTLAAVVIVKVPAVPDAAVAVAMVGESVITPLTEPVLLADSVN